MTAQQKSAAGASQAPSSDSGTRGALVFFGIVLLAMLGLLIFLVTAAGAELDPATIGLVVAAGALMFCLRTLYRMVQVLGRPDLDVELSRQGVGIAAGARELRDEKRRLLRALNELEFDFQMGKLSESDYRSVREAYELQAVEVMRALQGETDLHPDLVAELQARGLVPESQTEPGPEAEAESEVEAEPEAEGEPRAEAEPEAEPNAVEGPRSCESCGTLNDPDARFCKRCGAGMQAEAAQAQEGEAS